MELFACTQVDEDFIAAYQATYGFTETGEPIPPEVLAAKEKEEAEKLQQKIEVVDLGRFFLKHICANIYQIISEHFKYIPSTFQVHFSHQIK